MKQLANSTSNDLLYQHMYSQHFFANTRLWHVNPQATFMRIFSTCLYTTSVKE